MRDKLIHNYFGVDLDAVWATVEKDIPTLQNKLKEIIKKKTIKNRPLQRQIA